MISLILHPRPYFNANNDNAFLFQENSILLQFLIFSVRIPLKNIMLRLKNAAAAFTVKKLKNKDLTEIFTTED